MKKLLLVQLMMFAFLQGCAGWVSYNGLKAINPEYKACYYMGAPRVENIQPMFEWESKGEDSVYDFVIWSGSNSRRVVYYRESLKETRHKVEELVLKTDKVYAWSVRMHGEKDWSTLNRFCASFGGQYFHQKKQDFTFTIPKREHQPEMKKSNQTF